MTEIFMIVFGVIVLALIFRKKETVVQEVHISVPAIPHQLIMALVPDAEWDRTKNAVSFYVNEFEFMIDNNDELWYKSRIQSMTVNQEKWRKGKIEDFIKFLHPVAVERMNDSLTNQASQFNQRLRDQNKHNGKAPQLQAPKVPNNKGNNQQQRGKQNNQPQQQRRGGANVCSNADAKMYWENFDKFQHKTFTFEPNSPWYWEEDDNDGLYFVAKRGK